VCGICGITTVGDGNFDGALQAIRHRGPDGTGQKQLQVAGRSVWFGHTRLAVQDLSPAGRQPMSSQDGRWWITYNGEIYNHLQMRSQLSVEFKGHSDTETLLEYIARFGIEATLSASNGIFAFAALDIREKKLYLVRDPFGIKPLYYNITAQSDLAFASEIKALQKLLPSSGIVSRKALQTFLTLRYVPSPETLLQEVQRLPPGHLLCFDLASSAISLLCYIEPTTDRFSGTEQEAVESYHELLQQTVQRQLLSDVPVGILLSGGIDSALIASVAAQTERKLHGFTVGFGDRHSECELADAAQTAAILGMVHVPVQVTAEMLQNAFAEIIAAVEEPLGTTSVLPMWYLVQRARQDVTVVLTGQGSDEPWGGYRRYQVEILRRFLPGKALLKYLQFIPDLWKTMPEFLARGLRTLPVSEMPIRFVEAYSLFDARERQQLTGESGTGQATEQIRQWLEWLNGTDLPTAECMMRIDARMNLADDLLLYGDKISMAHSLEARVPMLDLELVKFVESLPLSYRLKLGRSKLVHKQTARRYLPAAVVNRRKKGFQVPFAMWSRTIWQEWVADWLLDSGSRYLQALDRSAVEKLWQSHLRGAPDRSRQIFALLMLAIWWQQQRVYP